MNQAANTGFEGSFLGQEERIDALTKLECGVCWWVYDPEAGDSVWQIAPGTAFAELPEHWRCPSCDAAQHQFMVLDNREARTDQAASVAPANVEVLTLRSRLLAAYAWVDERMRDLPVYRAELPTDVLIPQRCEAGVVSLVYTPWCMNLLLIADDTARLIEGSSRDVVFPSGSYAFIRGHLEGVGPIESCSLFSPMDEFVDADAVIAVGGEVLTALFREPEVAPGAAAAVPYSSQATADELENPDRRRFLGGSDRKLTPP